MDCGFFYVALSCLVSVLSVFSVVVLPCMVCTLAYKSRCTCWHVNWD